MSILKMLWEASPYGIRTVKTLPVVFLSGRKGSAKKDVAFNLDAETAAHVVALHNESLVAADATDDPDQHFADQPPAALRIADADMPPLDVIDAAAKVAGWFAARGVENWALGDVASRWGSASSNSVRREAVQVWL